MLHPEPRVFHQCRIDADTDLQPFAIKRCPCYQVIRVHSSEVGFSDQCSQTVDCTMPTSHSEIMNCNGQRDCSINESVVQYSSPDKLCKQRQDGNFITITCDCMNGTLYCMFGSSTIYFYCTMCFCENFQPQLCLTIILKFSKGRSNIRLCRFQIRQVVYLSSEIS